MAQKRDVIVQYLRRHAVDEIHYQELTSALVDEGTDITAAYVYNVLRGMVSRRNATKLGSGDFRISSDWLEGEGDAYD